MEATNQSSYVYVIAENDEGPCKVGIASNPKQRLCMLQIGNPRLLTLRHAEPVADAGLVERIAHDLLRKSAIRGEWFVTDAVTAIDAIKQAVVSAKDNGGTQYSVTFARNSLASINLIPRPKKPRNYGARKITYRRATI